MSNIILEKIESLPPLPKSVIQLEEFRQVPNKDAQELLKIIEKDPLIVTTLLKVANSAMFAFRSKVETPSRAISLLGVNFTISIALGSVVQEIISSNLDSYGVSADDFMKISNMATILINSWIASRDSQLKDDLMISAFLQEIGKFIISEVIKQRGDKQNFQKELRTTQTTKAEEKFAGHSCAKITANIFKHWNLSHNLIFSVGFVGDLKACPDEYKEKAKILEIIKILCDIKHPLSDDNIKVALNKAVEYNMDIEPLVNAIDSLKQKINNPA